MAVRSVIIAENIELPLHEDTGRIHRHEDHRLLQMTRGCFVGLAHKDRQLTARVAPPVDHHFWPFKI